MDITFNCNKCGQHLVVDEAGAGLSVPCPACGKEITVPAKPVWLRATNNVLRANFQMILEIPTNRTLHLAVWKVLKETGYKPETDAEGAGEDFWQVNEECLDLVIETNRNMALGYAQTVNGLETDALWAAPAWELTRFVPHDHPRGDTDWYQPGDDGLVSWEERWLDACVEAGDRKALDVFEATGRMVALKDSGVWYALGNGAGGRQDALGNPFPPFAWGSGMDRIEVERAECIDLGLTVPDDNSEKAAGMDNSELVSELRAELDKGDLKGIMEYDESTGKFVFPKLGDAHADTGNRGKSQQWQTTTRAAAIAARLASAKAAVALKTEVKGVELPVFNESVTGGHTDFMQNALLWLQHRFIPIDDERMTRWLRKQSEECGHCGQGKPRTVLNVCKSCDDLICPDCKAKGCTGLVETES